MKNIFSLDSKLMQGLSTVGDYIILNVLFLITSLPIVTIGAAKVALYRVMFDMLEDRGNTYKRYFKTFAAEFKIATPLWLLQLIALAFVFAELYIVANISSLPFLRAILVGLLILFLLIGSLFSNVPAQIALFASTRREYLKNALYILITKFPRCFAVGFLNLFPALLALFNFGYWAVLGPLWLLLYYSVTTNLGARLFRGPFSEYLAAFEEKRSAPPEEPAENGDAPESP